MDRNFDREQELYAGSRYSRGHSKTKQIGFDDYPEEAEIFPGASMKYREKCKQMLLSSAGHLKNPVTIVAIILLMGVYILLGVAGSIGFDYYNNEAIKNVTTNLDIIVNAVLGFFFGPVVCAVGVTLCGVARMIANGESFFIGNVLGAFIAGFIHGWFLYGLKVRWFGTRFKSFFLDLFVKIVATRFVVSTFINVLMMSAIYSLATKVPIKYFLIYYEKAGVPITSPLEFFEIFFLAIAFETILVFVALSCINFIVMKAFPSYFENQYLVVDEKGNFINVEDEMDGQF